MKEKTKKVLCIKDTIGFKKGEEVAMDSVYEKFQGVSYNELTEYFQEQKEEEKSLPRWKVGDYFVIKSDVARQFQKVSDLYICINGCNYYNGFLEDSLRSPTKEELSIYFR